MHQLLVARASLVGVVLGNIRIRRMLFLRRMVRILRLGSLVRDLFLYVVWLFFSAFFFTIATFPFPTPPFYHHHHIRIRIPPLVPVIP